MAMKEYRKRGDIIIQRGELRGEILHGSNSFLAGLKSVDICIKALSAVVIWAHDLKVISFSTL